MLSGFRRRSQSQVGCVLQINNQYQEGSPPNSRPLEQLTELRSPLAIHRCAGPVIRPRDVSVLAQSDHGFYCEGHSRLALTHGLVLGVVGNVGRAVKNGIDSVADIGPDHAAVSLFGMCLDRIAKVAEQCTGLDELDGLIETLTRSLGDADGVRVCFGAVAHIVGLVQIAMVAFVVECNIQVDNIAVHKHSLVGNAVADNLVDRGTYGFREVVVV